MATVSYDNVTQLLDVHVKIGDKLYNVSMSVDLRNYLPQFVAVGFSAATGVISELNGQSQILSWSFSSTMEPKQQKQPQKNISEDARLPELTPQMYRTVSEFAVTGRAVDALSVQSSSSTTTMTTGGHSKLSAESASSALLRDSKELA
ncbi:unnamed protein product [Miscanthus lutarioriparius]|uniref:Legume lectin domain-containing protein n=1 Tax=Miscanthus lutarioriparius TaxID=422564 RepID=A0A811SLV1_9POAL|nr:unnamed protein product [Miscanthus lutarioriparius]CAD6341581.1 unnamed protein product [Miscanthus lutarioriparius]